MVIYLKILSKCHKKLAVQNFQHVDVLVHKHTLVTMKLTLTLWYQKMTSVKVQCDVEVAGQEHAK
jgi:hypothetical protein